MAIVGAALRGRPCVEIKVVKDGLIINASVTASVLNSTQGRPRRAAHEIAPPMQQ